MLVTVTEWNEFRALDLKAAKAEMRGDVLVDLRNVFSRPPQRTSPACVTPPLAACQKTSTRRRRR